MLFTINETYLTDVLQQLVRTDSRNPSLTPGCPGEAEAAQLVADLMRTLGLDVISYDLGDNRANTVGILRGSGQGKALMLNAHLDTVAIEGMTEPFSADIREGKLYGRGSFDMKGSAAAQLAATKALLDAGITLAGDLLLTFVADEEYASIGTEDIVKHYTADAAIVTEPTGLSVCRTHRGFVWYKVVATGKAAHGSLPEVGIDANMHMGRFLAGLDDLTREFRKREQHPLVGYPSLHAAQIQGGTALSAYADQCVLKVERRLNPGETVEQATAELQAIADKLTAVDPLVQLSITPFFWRLPFETNPDSELIRVVDTAIEQHLGHSIPHTGMTGWTDAGILAEAGIESMLIGPSGDGAHAADEWVDLQSVVDLSHILADTVINFCGVVAG